MVVFEPRDICELVAVDDDSAFKNYLGSDPSGFAVVPEKYPDCEGHVLPSGSGDFAKWVKRNAPEIKVQVNKADKHLMLRSGEYWLALVFLASDVTIPVYLNIVANYLYDKMKGTLKGEKDRVHLSAIYEDKKEGVSKRFNFEGDSDSLQKAITKFKLNEFMDD